MSIYKTGTHTHTTLPLVLSVSLLSPASSPVGSYSPSGPPLSQGPFASPGLWSAAFRVAVGGSIHGPCDGLWY